MKQIVPAEAPMSPCWEAEEEEEDEEEERINGIISLAQQFAFQQDLFGCPTTSFDAR